jgi:hypothetical protein
MTHRGCSTCGAPTTCADALNNFGYALRTSREDVYECPACVLGTPLTHLCTSCLVNANGTREEVYNTLWGIFPGNGVPILSVLGVGLIYEDGLQNVVPLRRWRFADMRHSQVILACPVYPTPTGRIEGTQTTIRPQTFILLPGELACGCNLCSKRP